MTVSEAFFTLAQMSQPDVPCPVALTSGGEPFANAMCWLILRIALAKLSGRLDECRDAGELLRAIDTGEQMFVRSGVVDDVSVNAQCVEVMRTLREEQPGAHAHRGNLAQYAPSRN